MIKRYWNLSELSKASKSSISLGENILKSMFKRKYIIRNDIKPNTFRFLKNNKLRFWRTSIRISLNNSSSKITAKNKLAKIIMKYFPGDEITLRVLSGEEEKTITLILGEKIS